MKRKCFIGIIISLNLIILNVCSAFATSPTEITSAISAVISTLNAAEEGSARQQAVSEWIHKQSGALGFIFDLSSGSLSPALLKYLLPDPSQYESATDNEIVNACRDLILNHQTVVNNEIVLDNTLNTCIKNFVDSYVSESSGKIYYCYDLQQSQQYFTTSEIANISSILQDYPNYIFYLFYNRADNSNWLLGLSGDTGQLYGVKRLSYEQDAYWSIIFYHAKSVNGILSCERFIANSEADMVAFYRLNNSGNNFEKVSLNYPWNGTANNSVGVPYDSCVLTKNSGEGTVDNNFLNYPKGISTSNQSVLCFDTASALQTYVNTYGIGKQAYYYNNQVWSNFSSHSSGDYTVDNSNVNTVTYGDVISYVNDSHDTNNNYPDNSTVNNWIETTNNNNTGGGSGGGSGGSGDDSGGSGSGIVSILTALGKAIADLITGIAAFLAEVVGGLVEAITGLLDTLTDLITNFTESIPNIFSPLLGWLFDGLPEEFTAIILLGLTACVIASIIKILRG